MWLRRLRFSSFRPLCEIVAGAPGLQVGEAQDDCEEPHALSGLQRNVRVHCAQGEAAGHAAGGIGEWRAGGRECPAVTASAAGDGPRHDRQQRRDRPHHPGQEGQRHGPEAVARRVRAADTAGHLVAQAQSALVTHSSCSASAEVV